MKELMERAYRARAGIIGLLASCVCTYPLEKHTTASEHHEMCPAHYSIMRDRALEASATRLCECGRYPLSHGGLGKTCFQCLVAGVTAESEMAGA